MSEVPFIHYMGRPSPVPFSEQVSRYRYRPAVLGEGRRVIIG